MTLTEVFTVKHYMTPYSSLTCKKQFRNDFPISPVLINNILSDELFLWHSKCAGLWLYQCKTDSFQSSFQQLKSKHAFFATATSIHCQTVPGISPLHNLGWIFQLSCATQINSILSGELFAWHKKHAGQKMFLSSLSVLWQYGQYLSHFVMLSKKNDEITCSLDVDYHMEVYHTLQRFQTSPTSYTSHAHFIWVGYRYFRQKFPLLMKHSFTLEGKLLAKNHSMKPDNLHTLHDRRVHSLEVGV